MWHFIDVCLTSNFFHKKPLIGLLIQDGERGSTNGAAVSQGRILAELPCWVCRAEPPHLVPGHT